MRSLVVLAAVLAMSVAAPQDFEVYEPVQGFGVNVEESGYKPSANPEYNQENSEQNHSFQTPEFFKKKRSVGYGLVVPSSPVIYQSAVYAEPALRTVYTAPATTVYTAPVALSSAVSHQSRVDVHTSPAIVSVESAAVAAPAVEVKSVPVLTPSPSYTVYAGGSAVSQQSRVDVKSSPAVVTEQVVQPAIVAPAVFGTGPAYVDGRSVYYTPVTAYAHQPLVGVQAPTYYTQQVVSPLLLKKKRSSS